MDYKNIFKRSQPAVEQPATEAPSRMLQVPVIHKRKSEPKVPDGCIRGFDAAQSNNSTADWFAPTTNINQQLRLQLTMIRARCRERVQNDDYAKAYIRICVANIVGSNGINLQSLASDPTGGRDDLAVDAIEKAWERWAKYPRNVDVAGRENWLGTLEEVVRIIKTDGEVFIRHIEGVEGGEYGYKLQILDPSLCDERFNVDLLANGNIVIMGVELNQWMTPVAYYFSKPANNGIAQNIFSPNHIRVEAKDIIHAFTQEFASQVRGIPPMATSLLRLRMLSAFEAAALQNARVGAAKMGFYTRTNGDNVEVANAMDDDGSLVDEVVAGQFTVLPAGYDFKTFQAEYPNGEIAEFKKAMLRAFATSVGIDYATLSQDLESVNFASSRVAIIEAREQYKTMQQFIIDRVVTPVFERWLMQALLRKKITVNAKPLPVVNFEKYAEVNWIPRRWNFQDPTRDVSANIDMINNRIKSISSVADEIGIDFDTEVERMSRDELLLEKFGLTRLDNKATAVEPAADETMDNNMDGSITNDQGNEN
jgi:lambda family phage portal protein